ncbi:Arylsulfatase [Pontiella desulfatans]|uniref:Arylsulfatase n=2 Tax=Pontiella desulfatans TaxID=2750659 RepID=A0A6C2U098_PONDE|nr:sulfatase S1_4 [Kiritimatiellales bacterium]VGO13295.1 Arylsulfatase [Pontiella desulfatans]
MALGGGWAASALARSAGRPNILLILSDDMGWSDIGCFGGDAETPVLDGLAKRGIRFTQFYNSARCMPTRASLLTGLHPHQAGIGHMAGDWGTPAYSGHLLDTCVTLGEVLRTAGYHTSQLGKWHVGNRKKGVMPDLRGFDRSWTREGKVDYFKHDIYELDGKPWVCPDPGSFYSTEEMDRQAVGFIDDARKQDKPFFMYAAYDAAHWPLHARPEDIEKYRGRFINRGWDKMRAERFERQRELGVVSRNWKLQPRDPAVPAWDEVKEKELWDLKMAVYCAQIDAMDRSIGRIVAHLKKTGQLENTLVFFLQDNGACPEGIGQKRAEEPGTPESYVAYHMPWANLSNTPFKLYKHFTGEGGIRTPMIAAWPKGIAKPGRTSSELGHLVDIMATCVDVSGAMYPRNFNGKKITPMEGLSLDPVFKTGTRKGHEVFCWEHEGNRAVRKGKWKLMSRYEDDVKLYQAWGFPKAGRTVEWELYDMEADPTEIHDLSSSHPEVVAALAKEYGAWAEQVGAVPYAEISAKGKKKKK